MAKVKKTSLRDIAEAAGVSTALVSFVLNGKKKMYRVGEETAQRIIKIADELNYRPNLAAKSLRSGKTKSIGVVLSDISNPFFSQLARILEDEAIKLGYTVLFGSSDEDKGKMARIVSELTYKGVDGLIIVPCNESKELIASFASNNTPIVLFDRYFPDLNISYVALDNFKASYTLTRHLLDSGYNAPCIVAYDVDLIHMKERIRGYVKAMEEYGKSEAVKVMYLSQERPRESVEEKLSIMLDEGVDSFLFGTNMISLACLYVIKDMDEEVVGKIGMVAFDGSPVFDFFNVPISYIKQPIEKLVQEALKILMDRMLNENTYRSVLAEGDFIVNKH